MKTIVFKNLTLRLFMIVTLIMSVIDVFAYGSAKVNKVWLEHGVIKNGEKGMTIHTDISVSGIKGNRIEVIAYFYDEQKSKLKGGIGGYKTRDGQVCASDFGKSTYDDSRWEDFDIFIPLRAIPLASGKHTYYIIVDVKDVSQNSMMTDNWDYISFTGTGNVNNNQNYYADNNLNLESRIKLHDEDEDEEEDDDISTRMFYYECLIGFQGDIIAGDGKTNITVYYSSGRPYKVKSGNQSFNLSYRGKNNGWKIYGTQYQARQFGFNDYYVIDIMPGSTTYFNPKKGIVSGSPSFGYVGGMFGGNFNNGGSSGTNNSSSKICNPCGGSGRCTMCGGDGYYWLNSGGFIGKDIKTKQTCSSCHGTGRCTLCHGRGSY